MTTVRQMAHGKKCIWFILLSAFYYHSLMLSGMRALTYVYYYLIPLLYLLAHTEWMVGKLRKLFRGRLLYVPLCVAPMLFYGVFAPMIRGTYDFSYLLRGPMWWLVQSIYVAFFLLCVYENAVTWQPDTTEFIEYYVASQSCYVVGTLCILAIPGAREWVINHVYMSPLDMELIQRPEHISRIGWSGFAGFVPTMSCSICAALCFYLLFRYKDDKAKNGWYNVLMGLFIIGNMCYGRTGMVTSLLCFVLYFLCLLLLRPEKALLYFLVFALLLGGVVLLAQYKESMRAWFEWSFSQILSFVRTGSFETHTISSLKSMYRWPSLDTLLFGDGLYTEAGHYYMGTDVGWLRPIYFYGLLPAASGFVLAVCSIVKLRRTMEGVSGREIWTVILMLLMTYLIFESKGETFYVFASALIPILLVGRNEELIDSRESRRTEGYSGAHIGSAKKENMLYRI